MLSLKLCTRFCSLRRGYYSHCACGRRFGGGPPLVYVQVDKLQNLSSPTALLQLSKNGNKGGRLLGHTMTWVSFAKVEQPGKSAEIKRA